MHFHYLMAQDGSPPILWFLVLGIVLLAAIWAIVTYNTLVRLRQHCRESWSGIDTELRRRYDLIPNLLETVKGYAAHERTVLAEVVEARNRAVASVGSPASQARDENLFVAALRQLFAVVERYPDLKASANFLELQKELANTEDRIQAARRFYNANVRDLNTRIGVFPSNLIAAVFSFKAEEFFEIEDAGVRAAPAVTLGERA
ncbi:MAG: LemA family protein [Phycisphaerae bacterium]|nr:LemA family protein [Phycisphaerae bacterium]